MGKITGGLAAVTIWFGAAAAAEAQGINVDVTNPACVLHNQSTTVVTATVTGASTYNYTITIVVNGIVRVDHKAYYGSGSAISKGFNISSWGLQAGQSFVTTVDITYPGLASDTLGITVLQGPTTYLPNLRAPSQAPAAIKEEEFALVLSDEEAAA